MAPSSQTNSWVEQISEAVAEAVRTGATATQAAVNNMNNTTAAVEETVVPAILRIVEQGTETIGHIATPIATHPLTQYAAKVPGISWLLTALGQVDLERVQRDIEQLRREHPLETPEQLAQRIIIDTSLKAGGIGLLTNFVPPLALALFAVDLAAIATLQAEMVYRIAAAYGFELQDPARRGEVLAIFALSVGGAGPLKAGLSIVEILPLIGAAIGATSNAAVLYSLGYTACRYYEAKRKFTAPTVDI